MEKNSQAHWQAQEEFLVRDILRTKVYLSMKSLQTRLKSLSKDLFNFCITPKFFTDHFFGTTKRNQLLILDRFYWKDDKVCGQHLFLLDVKRKVLKELHVPRVTNSDMGFKVVGSCNGLVCVAHYSLDPASTLFLWNPTTGQTKRIMEPQEEDPLLPHKMPPNCLIGFFFNHNESGDYQVVRLHSFWDNTTSDGSLGKTHNAIRVEKYSLCTGLWRDIKCCCDKQYVTVNGRLFWTENSVILKGTLFWVAMEVSEKVSHEMIISFNSCNNVVSKIEMPCSAKDCAAEVYKKLAVYKDKVAVIICSEKNSMEQCLDLWVFYDEYEGVECWNKVLTIGRFSRLERPVGTWKNEVLMATKKGIHSVSGIIAMLPEDDDLVGAEYSYNVLSYEESFVPLHNVEEDYPIESEGFLLV